METDQSARLANATELDVTRWVAAGTILAIPFGSTESHGPHLPLSTDTDLATALCRRLAAARKDILIAPPIGYGASDEQPDSPGTLSIGPAAMETVVVALVRSAGETFKRVLLVSAHGNNAPPIARALDLLRTEGRDVRVHVPMWPDEPRAGRAKTSVMLVLEPEHVHMERATGESASAYADEGRLILEALTSTVITDVAGWWGPPR